MSFEHEFQVGVLFVSQRSEIGKQLFSLNFKLANLFGRCSKIQLREVQLTFILNS